MWIWLRRERESRSLGWRGHPSRTSSSALGPFLWLRFLFPPQTVCCLCGVCEETVVWQRGTISLMFAVLLAFFPVIAPEGLWLRVQARCLLLCFYGFPAVCSALSQTDSLSSSCLRPHTLIKLLSITQNDEVKPECFCKFILKKEKSKHPWQPFEPPVFLV